MTIAGFFDKNHAEKKSFRLLFLIGTGGTFLLNMTSLGAVFLTSVLLARFLGSQEYGVYAYTMAWIKFLTIPVLFGFDRLLIREISAYTVQSKWGLIKGLLRRADQIVLFTCLLLAGGAVSLIRILPPQSHSTTARVLLIALALLPLTALMTLRQSAIQGFQRVIIGRLPETVIRPVLFTLLILCGKYYLGQSFTALAAIALNLAAFGTGWLASVVLLRAVLPDDVKRAAPVYETGAWIQSALPIIAISSMMIINSQTDTLMLGTIRGTEYAGIYAVAHRGAGLIALFLTAINVVLAPTISSLYAARELERLQQVITRSARLVLGFTLPLALALMLGAKWFLNIFGKDFTIGVTALIILGGAYLMNVAAGSVGLLLVMTGHQRDSAWGIGISALINVVLNAAFIPKWGLEGAAVATSISMLIWNVLLSIRVYQRLGIYATALGRISGNQHYAET